MKFFLFSIVLTSFLFAQPEVPLLNQWATDLTNTLTNSQLQTLNQRLETFEDTTSNQLVMLMITSLDDYPIEYFSYEVAQKNKIGTEEHDNGALLFIARNDRKLRIEVGYGLEGALPDALANSIIRNVIVPHFKRENFYEGISSGINAIISAIAGEYKAENVPSDEEEPQFFSIILMILFGLFMFFFRGRGRRGGLIYYGGFGGGRSSGGFGSGGGGFSGGGGSFGGGGSSGSW